MKKVTVRCLLSLLTVLPSVAVSKTVYLSPKGSDSSTNCTQKQPCQTINGIQSKLASGDTVILEQGAYVLSSSGASPSGPIFAKGGTSGVTYAAPSGQIPVITGAQSLTSPLTSKWSSSSTGVCQGISRCYVATVPSGSSLVNFEYLLYVPTGQTLASQALLQARRSQSQTVNAASSYPTIACEVPPGSTGCSTGLDGQCNDRVVVNSSDVSLITSSSHNLHDIRFYNFWHNHIDALRISQVNTGYTQAGCSATQGTGLTEFIFTGPGNSNGFLAGLRYMIVNSREYFESNALPGTFYLDCGSSACVDSPNLSGASIYYIANSGEHPGPDQIWGPQLSQLISDTPANGVVNNVTFEGIYFVADNFVSASSTGFQSNPGLSLAPAALSFVDTADVSLQNVVIAHTSGWGLEFTNDNCNYELGSSCTVTGASTGNSLSDSVLYDIGGPGLRLGRYPPDGYDDGNTYQIATQFTTVENNLFAGLGRMYPGGQTGCIWIGSSHDNTIKNNECSDVYAGGIGIGPGVAFPQDYVYNNIVENNLFHDLGQEVITDFGCVHFANQGGYNYTYKNFPQPLGNTFMYNVCYNVTHAQPDNGSGYDAGIYIDNNSQGNTASYNLVFRTSGPLFFNNESPNCINRTSCENTAENNILAFSIQGALRRGNGYPIGDSLRDFTFAHNVVSFDAQRGPQWLFKGEQFWDCQIGGTTGSFLPPCTNYFNFLSNGYWNPNYTAQTVQFYTNSPTSSWMGLAKWQAANPKGPGEDGPDNGGVAAYSNPMWVDTACSGGTTDYNPSTSFHFGSGSTLPTTIKFDTSGFAQTYDAGRTGTPALCNPSSSCVAAATFPPAAAVPACNSSSW
ncbi:MAG TPA: hypothetical protein VMT20_17535 [Terriglobia bacterium]|nr:hypothetical protein [Terriglobia bacterium]